MREWSQSAKRQLKVPEAGHHCLPVTINNQWNFVAKQMLMVEFATPARGALHITTSGRTYFLHFQGGRSQHQNQIITGRRCWWVRPARSQNVNTRWITCFSCDTAPVTSRKILLCWCGYFLSNWIWVFRGFHLFQWVSWCIIIIIFSVQNLFECCKPFQCCLSAYKLTIWRDQSDF